MSKLLREYTELEYDKALIKEALGKNTPIVLKTILQRADAPNQNKRIYPRSVLDREVENYKKLVSERTCYW